MNFLDFKYKVKEMELELRDKGIKETEVKISYTRATGENIIVAMTSDTNVAAYFKW